ncbi:MAG: co-chaperone GroES [Euryarchaeota archaeon]|nr:co-chaperone GroES [Euryarchaeota archaeon]
MKKFTPVGDRVLISVRKYTDTETMKGGIYIPETAQKSRPQMGDVMAVGADVTELEVGDTVLLPKYGGIDVEFRGERMTLMPTEEIIGKFVNN